MNKRHSVIDLHASSSLIKGLNNGELLVIGFYQSSNICFIYKYDDGVYLLDKDNMYPFSMVYSVSIHKYLKCKCSLSYVQDKVNEYQLRVRSKYSLHYGLEKGQVFDISGAQHKPMDYLYVYDIRTFESHLGLLIGSDRVLLDTGAIKNINLCRKLTNEEIESNKDKCLKLSYLYKSMITDNVKREVRDFKVGDVYKKGDLVYIYLGKAQVKFTLAKDYLERCSKEESFINKLTVNIDPLCEYYANVDRKDDLWFKLKLSEDSRMRNVVLKVLNNEPVNVGMMGLRVLIHSNLGTYKIKTYNGSDFEVNGPIESLRYNIPNSRLGSYFMHWDFSPEELKKYTYRVTTRGDRICQCIRKSIAITID